MNATAIVMRKPASAQLLVSSTDRYPDSSTRLEYPTTSADWKLNLRSYPLQGYFKRLAITQIQFQWNIPTIVDGKNDVFVIQIDGNPYVIALTPGFYSGEDLATEIEDEVIAQGGVDAASFTATFAGGAFTFEIGAGHTFAFTIPPDTTDPDTIINNRFLITIGATASSVNPTLSYTTGIAPLIYTRFVDMCSSYLTKWQSVKDNTTHPNGIVSSVLARIYAVPPNVLVNAAQAGQLFAIPWQMTVDFNVPKFIEWSPQETIANFDIQLRDEYGDLIYWSQDFPTEYQFTLFASED